MYPRLALPVALPLLLSCAASAWASTPAGSTVINPLPTLGGSQIQANALSANGRIAGFSYVTGNLEAHAFLYSSGAISDLGTLGGTVSIANGLNAAGLVVGQSGLSDGSTHAFVFGDQGIIDLGTLGGSYSTATCINDQGMIAGQSYTDFGYAQAWVSTNDTLIDIGDLGGGYSEAVALNASGLLAGNALTASFEFHPFLYANGAMTDLGELGGGFAVARALNDSGMVVGDSSLTNGETHAFLYAQGGMTDLGTLGGAFSGAFGINSNGLVIGTSGTADFRTHGFIYANGTMTDLGTLGGTDCLPSAINNAGQIVGVALTATGQGRAFIWQNGRIQDLNSLLPAGSGWELTSAQLINDAGRIVGQGVFNGVFGLFVLDLASANQPPVIKTAPELRGGCQDQIVLDASQSTDPDGDQLSFEWTAGGSVLGNTAILSGSFPLGTTVVTLKVTDAGGLAAQTNVTVVISDTLPPRLTCPAPVTLGVGLSCQAAVPNLLAGLVVADDCTPAASLTLVQSPAAGTLLSLGQQTVTITATDASGNSAQCQVLVTVTDTTAPIITAPAPVTLPAGANCQAVLPDFLAGLAVSDNCTPAASLTLAQSPAAGTLLGLGQQTVTITATDASGNSAQCQVVVTVADATAPVINSLTANPAVLDPPNHQIIPVTIAAAAVDNCDAAPVSKIISVTCNEAAAPGEIQVTGDLTVSLAATRDSLGSGRIYTVTVQSTDQAGNSALGTVTVVVPKGNKPKNH